MILFKAEAILASNISKFGKNFPAIDREDFKSSNESTISTSLIHNIASEGKSEQVVTWFFESNLPTEECRTCREFVELQFRYLLSLLSNHRILWIMVDGVLANVGIGIVSLLCSSSLAKEVPFPIACGTETVSLGDLL